MGFASYDAIINAITQNSTYDRFGFYQVGTVAQVGVWQSMWPTVGCPGSGAAPNPTGTVYSPTFTPGATAGGINFGSCSPNTRHILTYGATATQTMTLRIYDRLVAVGAVSTHATGNVTINSPALPRYTNGVGVEVWLEYTTASTTTAAVINLSSYTNQAGTPNQAGANVTMPAAAMGVNNMVQLPIQAGDTGVQAISQIHVTTANTSGVVNVVMLRPIADIPLAAEVWNERDMVLQLTALERLYDTHCLDLMYLPSITTAANVWGAIRTANN